MDCDMCGSETKLFKTIIEGTEMNVCTECSRFGKVLGELREEQKIKKQPSIQQPEVQRPTLIQSIVKDYAIRRKSAREKLNLKQKNFAQKISEKQSTVHIIETGIFEPNFPLVRKIEKFLKGDIPWNAEANLKF